LPAGVKRSDDDTHETALSRSSTKLKHD
jgi:hypothetical protein